MRWASAISTAAEPARACFDAAAAIQRGLDGAGADLVLVFASHAHGDAWPELRDRLSEAFPGALLLGCSAQCVIGDGREVEEGPGLSLTAASLPGSALAPFHIDPGTLPEGALGAELFGVPANSRPSFIVLADPFTTQTESLLQCLDASFPACVKIGGLASGGAQPGENTLLLGEQLQHFGLVGVAISGGVRIDAIVAQGCRPIGQPMFVTGARENLLLELDGQPPVRILQELYDGLGPGDQQLARSSLFLGLVMREGEVEYRQGDFLIRNLAGMDQESGAVAVAANLDEARVVQFHLRDARTSAEDLRDCLSRYARDKRAGAPAGALLFSCLGRGRGLYGEPDHDSRMFREHLGPLPLGGFFCNGEIGPVQGRTYLHGYTSSFGIFRTEG